MTSRPTARKALALVLAGAALMLGTLLYASVAGAVTVAIVGPVEADAGNAVFLQAETDAKSVEWIILPVEARGNFVPLPIFQGMTPDGKPIVKHCAFFSSTKPGVYNFVLAGASGDSVGVAVHTLTNGKVQPQPDPSPDPEPNPDPQPNPDPTPPPPPGKRFVMIVRETGESVAQQSKLTPIVNAVRDYARSKNHQWRIEDPDLKDRTGKPPAWFQTYLDRLAQAGVSQPALIVGGFDASGQVVGLKMVPLPSTPAAAVAIIQQHGG